MSTSQFVNSFKLRITTQFSESLSKSSFERDEVDRFFVNLAVILDRYLQIDDKPNAFSSTAIAGVRGSVETLLSLVPPEAFSKVLSYNWVMKDLQVFINFLDIEIKSFSFQNKIFAAAEKATLSTKSILVSKTDKDSFSLVKTFFNPNIFSVNYAAEEIKSLYLGVWFSFKVYSDPVDITRGVAADFLVVPAWLVGVFYWNFCYDNPAFFFDQLALCKSNPESHEFPLEVVGSTRKFKDGTKWIHTNSTHSTNALLSVKNFEEALLPESFSKSDLEPHLEVVACLVREGASLQDALSAALSLAK